MAVVILIIVKTQQVDEAVLMDALPVWDAERKCAERWLTLGGCQGDESVTCIYSGLSVICLLCVLKTYGLYLLTEMLSPWSLLCDFAAGDLARHRWICVLGARAQHIRTVPWGIACAKAVGEWCGHHLAWEGGRTQLPKISEVTHSVKQVERKEG